MEWIEETWPRRVQSTLKKMWNKLKMWKQIEAIGHQTMVDATAKQVEAIKQKELIEKEMERTKKIADMLRGSGS